MPLNTYMSPPAPARSAPLWAALKKLVAVMFWSIATGAAFIAVIYIAR